jgi:hypothetical protein
VKARLLACPACTRHVRIDELRCPFCGGPLPDSFGKVAAPSPPPAGLSRAGLYAYGVAVGVGVLVGACNRSPSVSKPGEAENPPTASVYGAPMPSIDAGTVPMTRRQQPST